MEYSSSDRFAVVLACLAGVMAIVLFLIEKTPLSVVVLLIFMAGLSVYPVIHFLRSSAGRAVTLLAVISGTVVFGYYVWPHNVVKGNEVIVTRHDAEKQLAPEQTKTAANVTATIDRKATEKVKLNAAPDVKPAKRQEVAAPVQSCPNGICIGGDNNGTATVNNFVPIGRVLTESQAAAFSQKLGDCGSYQIGMRHATGNAESSSYAEQFARAIGQARWTFIRPKFLIQENEGHGILVLIPNAADVPATAECLVNALTSIGIAAPLQRIDGLNETDLYVGLQ